MQRATTLQTLTVGCVVLLIAACSRQGPPVNTDSTATPPSPSESTPPSMTEMPTAEPPALVGTAWVAEFIEGKGKLDNAQSTLEFLPEARATGGAGCNRYGGAVEIAGDSVQFGALMATKMACPLMAQEQKFLDALAAARIYKLENGKLVLIDEAGMTRVRLAANTNPKN